MIGNSFERIFVALISVATGITLIYLAIQGPLFLQHIKYKTAEFINNQLVTQDFVNMFLISPILIACGVTLFFRKQISQYLLTLVRPNTSYPIQFMFYGFFLTMIIAVNAMGIVMFLTHDPTFMIRDRDYKINA